MLHSYGDYGIPRVKKAALTVPMSPAITKPKKPSPPPPSPPRIVKANPLHIPKPFQPKLEHRKIKPSKIELPGLKIHEKKREEFEKEVKRQMEEAKRAKEFKAQPMPDLQAPEVSDHAVKTFYFFTHCITSHFLIIQ
jgi:hypothetical protein